MTSARTSPAEILREYGPFPVLPHVHGLTWDGRLVWAAGGDRLHALDPATGELVRAIDVPCQAGTAFDGAYLYQIDGDRIQKIEPHTGHVLGSIPTPGPSCAGLTWAEGALWVGRYSDREIVKIDPETGRVRQTIATDRFVTGVTWAEGELWHGVSEGDEQGLRQVDPRSGEVLARVALPAGMMVSGLEYGGGDVFYAGGGRSGRVRAIRRPRR